jgi:putative transposase
MARRKENSEASNSRNGYGKKTVVTDTAWIELDVPRDRQSTFDPHLIAKYQPRFAQMSQAPGRHDLL